MIHSTLNTGKRCIKHTQRHNYKILRKEDFKEYNFTLESSKILYSKVYYENYLNNPENADKIKVSEPLYY
jgi:hypothetical protein